MIKNLDKINILKKDKIKRGLEFVENFNKKSLVIDKIIIFGSAIRDDCTVDGDIDLCYFTNREICDKNLFDALFNLGMILDDLFDFLPFYNCDESLRKQILEKGIVVYDYI